MKFRLEMLMIHSQTKRVKGIINRCFIHWKSQSTGTERKDIEVTTKPQLFDAPTATRATMKNAITTRNFHANRCTKSETNRALLIYSVPMDF